jgi:genome maintenance exonuclease 1
VIQPPKQDLLAGLRKWTLERDDESDPGGRIYRDNEGNVYHSVTRILSATAPEHQKQALAKWLERPTAIQERDQAATRGSQAHSHAEYVLKTGAKLARQTANKKGVWKTHSDGLERCPASITRWAIQKAVQGAPRVSWNASGYARGLRSFIEERVTAIHSIEFSVHHPGGFAGTCDFLGDIDGRLTVVDWKTSQNAKISEELGDSRISGYICQTGAYSLGLRHLTGIQAEAGAVVIARRSGAPEVRMLNKWELRGAEQEFLDRLARYYEELEIPSR